jgi:hypothetical protein
MSQRLARVAILSATVLGAWCSVSALLWTVGVAALASIRAPGPSSLDAMATLPAAVLVWLCLSWLVAGALLVCASSTAALTPALTSARAPALSGRRAGWLAERLTPLLLRRLTWRLLSVSLGAVVATGPALVGGPAQGDARSPAVAGLPVPGLDRPAIERAMGSLDRPAARTAARSHPAHPRQPAGQSVMVHVGDTLWDIAARQLGPGARPGEIAREWPRWHAANRAVIGPDPRRLQPGQVLVPPTTTTQRHEESR